MTKLSTCALLICLIVLPAVASDPEDAVADTVAAAFVQARLAAHLPELKEMGRNKFREKICKHDMRFSAGLINDVVYETSDPAHLPASAQRLAAQTYYATFPARFGVGVCLLGSGPPGSPKYSVLIATYESRSASFWRTFD